MNRCAVAALTLLTMVAGCGDDPHAPAATPSATQPVKATAKGTFVPAASAPADAKALLYEPSAVQGSPSADLTLISGKGRTMESLVVTGFDAKRRYGAHLHTERCGTDPSAAGPHFQHHADPKAGRSPSTDPSYANPHNEAWLDFTTDASGRGEATAEQDWELTPDHRPYSLVIHAEPTSTKPGSAGAAGSRVACLTITY
ncbi:superoxide dismutase family protein [Dactylosporangium roseum]|nr:superoxide dismutase family protein [Dactylosporangium roseum]